MSQQFNKLHKPALIIWIICRVITPDTINPKGCTGLLFLNSTFYFSFFLNLIEKLQEDEKSVELLQQIKDFWLTIVA